MPKNRKPETGHASRADVRKKTPPKERSPSQNPTTEEFQNQEAVRRWKNEGGSRNDNDNG